MNANEQNNFERIADLHHRGQITTDEANVRKVLANRLLVVSKIPASVRKALNNAVKEGRLAHIKKDGIKPEVYYSPDFRYMAVEARNKAVDSLVRAYSKIIAPSTPAEHEAALERIGATIGKIRG